MSSRDDMNSSTKSSSSKDDKNAEKIKPASFSALFRFASYMDIAILLSGFFMCILMAATLPAINIVFGDMIDATATAVNTQDVMLTAIKGMCALGAYGFVTFFLSFFLCGWAGARIANGYRHCFLEAVLRQDAEFFDHAVPGSLSNMLSDAAFDIQNGLSDKFAGLFQGVFQFAFGFGVAFYFGPLLSLVLLACAPVMAGIMTLMITWGSSDGIFGKEAYESAASVATETLSNIRTVFSLNVETSMSRKYDSKLGEAEKAAIKQGSRQSCLGGALFAVMFCMYGLGFWYGAKIIADSTDNSIRSHPLPPAFLSGEAPFTPQQSFMANLYCNRYLDLDKSFMNATSLSPDTITDSYEICVCGLPWDTIPEAISPNCGCGADSVTNMGGRFTTNEGCFTGGRTLLVFFSILIGAFSAGQIGPGVKALSDARISAAKMLKVIDRYPVIDATITDGKVRLTKRATGRIVLENLHFRYKATLDENESDNNTKAGDEETPTPIEGRIVFGGCNLTMEPGQTVALVGESGCGKSTIAKLIQRFYDPTDGRILLDGMDLKDLAVSDLRAQIGVVSQEPLLFDASIRDNIRYGKPDATDAEIIQAAKSANAHTFIEKFPDKYDTMVGPSGGKLSGGQKQRVAIARAIVRNPAILILDEATSALDNKSEAVVQKALDDLLKLDQENNRQRTTIVIAHRLSTVRNADKIVVLGSPEGTSTASTGSIILEEGSHNELMKIHNGFYKALVGAGERDVKTGSIGFFGGASKTSFNDTEVEVELEDDVEVKDEKLVEVDLENGRTGVSENDGEIEKGKKKSFWKRNKKDKDEQELEKVKEEKIKAKANKKRVWKYTWPELPYILVGGLASICKGSIFPILSLVFSEMIIVWYDSDTDAIRNDSLKYSYMFYGLGLASFVFEFVQKFLFEKVGERLTRRLRSDVFRAMLRQDVTWFEAEENSIGNLNSRLSTDVKLVRLVVGQSTAAALESVAALATGIIIAVTASWQIFLVMLAMVPLMGIGEMLQMKALMGSEGDIRGGMGFSTQKLHETVSGIREVQAFSLEATVVADIRTKLFDTIGPASRRAAVLKGFMMGILQVIMFGTYALAFWVGSELIDNGSVTFENFNKALWAMAFSASGLGQAAIFAGDAAKANAAVKAIFDVLDYESTILSEPWEDKGLADRKTEKCKPRALPDETLEKGTVRLDKVNFAYPTRKAAKIFNQIDLAIPSGKVVALVGSSGSGKSTVIQMLERFYDPASYKEVKNGEITEMVAVEGTNEDGSNVNGTVLIDDTDMRTSDCRWLRHNIGLVGQEPVLFDDTVYNNIALGKDGCTREEVEEAARAANAYDFIQQLPEGFDTPVGRGGSKVSGGQKQRIAIARALVKKPKLLLLDEATSALDNESEKIVQASLDAMIKSASERNEDRTTIIIAHRLSTIRDADVICVLENDGDGSRVVEVGSHNELMKLGKKYKALVEAYDK